MALKAGTFSNLSSSMAQAMENAFVQAWPSVMGSDPLPSDRDQIKLLFIAVAQGVVKHLSQNPGSFEIATDSSHDHGGAIDDITTTGTLY